MSWLQRRSAVLSFGFAVLLTIAFGAPLMGAGEALLWKTTEVVDGPQLDQLAAERLLQVVSPRIEGLRAIAASMGRGASAQSCFRKIDIKPRGASEFDPVQGLVMDISDSWSSRDETIEQDAKLAALIRLPPPVLGALDRCVAASILAPACERIASDRLERETKSIAQEVSVGHDRSLRRYRSSVCAVAEMATRGGAQHSEKADLE